MYQLLCPSPSPSTSLTKHVNVTPPQTQWRDRFMPDMMTALDALLGASPGAHIDGPEFGISDVLVGGYLLYIPAYLPQVRAFLLFMFVFMFVFVFMFHVGFASWVSRAGCWVAWLVRAEMNCPLPPRASPRLSAPVRASLSLPAPRSDCLSPTPSLPSGSLSRSLSPSPSG